MRDRLSFQRFLALSPEDKVPDTKTLWLFCAQLARRDLVEKLFEAFDREFWYSGIFPKGGQVIDASLVSAPRNRNHRDENKETKEGKAPEDWDK